jgi:hypothetical protein
MWSGLSRWWKRKSEPAISRERQSGVGGGGGTSKDSSVKRMEPERRYALLYSLFRSSATPQKAAER